MPRAAKRDLLVPHSQATSGAITTSGAVTSNNGAIELTAQGGALSTIALGGDVTADDDASFNGNVTSATAGLHKITAGDAVDLSGNLTGAAAAGALEAPARAIRGRLHDAFDGFRSLKLLHALRDAGLPDQPIQDHRARNSAFAVAAALLMGIGLAVVVPTFLLALLERLIA